MEERHFVIRVDGKINPLFIGSFAYDRRSIADYIYYEFRLDKGYTGLVVGKILNLRIPVCWRRFELSSRLGNSIRHYVQNVAISPLVCLVFRSSRVFLCIFPPCIAERNGWRSDA